MIKVDIIGYSDFESAFKAMRNPMSSWDKSDSKWVEKGRLDDGSIFREYVLGEHDKSLAQRLFISGVEHRTFARMVYVTMDITAPLYWWKEMDRYTVGKSQVSTSTMHKIHAREFTLDDFSHEHLFGEVDNRYANQPIGVLQIVIECLNHWRKNYLETKDKDCWWQLIQLLPSSYNQKRTVCMSYEVVFKIIHERTGHKLDEWNDFVKILKDLPYVEEIMGD